jgi:SAM-dependent methyltransferase
MLGQIDDPPPESILDGCAFFVRGWLSLGKLQPELEAVEISFAGTLLAETAWFYARPDVERAEGLSTSEQTGFFAFSCRASEFHGVTGDLTIAARLRGGNRTPLLSSRSVTFLPFEKNPLALLSTRLDATARGLEIGAHSNPTAGLTPYYTDVASDFAGTRGRADFLSDASALPIESGTLDYLCSSHVLEHLADPLNALLEWHRVLREGGLLYLVVPDKTQTFDNPRKLTSPLHLLRDFRIQMTALHSTDHIDDFVSNAVWSKLRPKTPPEKEAEDRILARKQYLDDVRSGKPLDIHFHTFTPDSLRTLFLAAGLIGGEHPHFSVIAEAEKYPGDRQDGVGLLLRRCGATARNSSARTFELQSQSPNVPSLPLVCPVSLKPLSMQYRESQQRLLRSANGRQYRLVDGIPDLKCRQGERPTRPWSRWTSRWRRYLSSVRRLQKINEATKIQR